MHFESGLGECSATRVSPGEDGSLVCSPVVHSWDISSSGRFHRSSVHKSLSSPLVLQVHSQFYGFRRLRPFPPPIAITTLFCLPIHLAVRVYKSQLPRRSYSSFSPTKNPRATVSGGFNTNYEVSSPNLAYAVWTHYWVIRGV